MTYVGRASARHLDRRAEARPTSLQDRDGRTISSFIVAARPPRLDRGMLAQVLAHRLAQRAGAEAVNDAHRLLALEQRAIEELVGGFQGVVHSRSDEIQFGCNFGFVVRWPLAVGRGSRRT